MALIGLIPVFSIILLLEESPGSCADVTSLMVNLVFAFGCGAWQAGQNESCICHIDDYPNTPNAEIRGLEKYPNTQNLEFHDAGPSYSTSSHAQSNLAVGAGEKIKPAIRRILVLKTRDAEALKQKVVKSRENDQNIQNAEIHNTSPSYSTSSHATLRTLLVTTAPNVKKVNPAEARRLVLEAFSGKHDSEENMSTEQRVTSLIFVCLLFALCFLVYKCVVTKKYGMFRNCGKDLIILVNPAETI